MRDCTGKTFIRKVPPGFSFVSSCSFISCFVLTGLLCISSILLNAQQSNPQLLTSKDLGDIMRQLFHKKPDTTVKVTQTSISALPSLGYNPSYGFVFGAKASVLKQYGQASNTDLSAFGLEAFCERNSLNTFLV